MSTANRPISHTLLIASVGLPLVFAAGCRDGSDDAEVAIAESRGQLEALETTRHVTLPAAVREHVYQDVASKLRPLASGADEPAGSTAKLLLAEALAGQAALAGERYRSQSIEGLRLFTQSESLLDLYSARHALADALSGYDPTADVAAIDGLTSERNAEHSEISQDVKRREEEINALLDEAAQIKLLAEDKRRETGALRTEALDAAPSRRTSLLLQAQEIRRERERLFVDAERLETQADRLEPELGAARLQLQRVDLQLQQLSAARDRTLTEADALRNESADSRQDAGDTAQSVVQALDALATLLQGDLAQAFEAASSKYDEARGMASRAGRDASEAAKRAVLSMVDLSRASVSRDQGELLARAAKLMSRASQAMPSLPRSGEWSSKSQEFEQQALALQDQANEAYQAAAGAVRQAARGSGDSDKADRIAEQLERLAGLEIEEPDDSDAVDDDAPQADDAADDAGPAPAAPAPDADDTAPDVNSGDVGP